MYDITSKPVEVVPQRNDSAPQSQASSDVAKNVSAVAVSKSGEAENFSSEQEKDKPSFRDTLYAADELNRALNSMSIKRQFSVEESINEVVVKIIDTEDDEVIRQIPSEEAVKLSKNVKEMVGMLFDKMS